jgi:bifunctional UDP-N-acetylglucosamine pyrophosphorylase/glucosamine-1-phosphate N-acetyltransferase/UDP-N-acetylglucosamine pyrophosphorylase
LIFSGAPIFAAVNWLSGELPLDSTQQTAAVVLAAGKGTRMKSELPKVLVPVAGRPMIEYVLDALSAAGIADILLVVGYRSDLVRAGLANRPGLTFVEQAEQLGTGHAVMVCRPELERRTGAPVFVLAGDSPMMQASSLASLVEEFTRRRPACLIGTADKENPAGLGRIVRDAAGNFDAIVEEKDATESQRAIREVNLSTYLFDCRELLWALDRVRNDNAQREYYITDVPGILKRAGKQVVALKVLKPIESLSINTVDELALVERELVRMRE